MDGDIWQGDHHTPGDAVTAVMLAAHWRMRDTTLEAVVERTPAWVIAAVWTLMVFATITTQGSGNAFIYFQF